MQANIFRKYDFPFDKFSPFFDTPILRKRPLNVQCFHDKTEMSGDYAGILQFANKHNLAVLAWASKRVWTRT